LKGDWDPGVVRAGPRPLRASARSAAIPGLSSARPSLAALCVHAGALRLPCLSHPWRGYPCPIQGGVHAARCAAHAGRFRCSRRVTPSLAKGCRLSADTLASPPATGNHRPAAALPATTPRNFCSVKSLFTQPRLAHPGADLRR